ncbi:MAG: helix-turn-helix transcriptional regulator [Anaerovoracaceae bacterium]|nr:helix-turn-helix transcriptional regulator [Clostridiales bacterium]
MLENNILNNPWDIFDNVNDDVRRELELTDMLVDIACRIITYRLDNNITQKQLGEKLNITQAMVSKLESGEYNPSIGYLFKIADKLGWKFQLIIENNLTDKLIQYNMEGSQMASAVDCDTSGRIGCAA